MRFLKKTEALEVKASEMAFEGEVSVNYITEADLKHGLPGKWVESSSSKANIKWSAELETRDWGIKSLSFTVPDQEINIVVEKEGDDEFVQVAGQTALAYSDGDTQTVKMQIKNVKTQIDLGDDDKDKLQFFPTEIEFYNKTVTVKFGV